MALIEAKMRRARIFQLAWIFRVSDFFRKSPVEPPGFFCSNWVEVNFKIQVSLKLWCLIEVGYKKRGRLETYFLSKEHAILCKTDLTTDRGKSKVFCIDFYRTH